MNKEEILKQVGFDLEKAKQIHAWLNETPTANAVTPSTKKPVSIHYDENGNADGILIQTLDQSFILDLHDAEGGKQMNWRDAMKKYKMPTIQQWLLVMVYKDEVNKCLVEAGGEELKTDDGYWSSSEYNSYNAWGVSFSGFNSYCNYKNGSDYVRAVAAS